MNYRRQLHKGLISDKGDLELKIFMFSAFTTWKNFFFLFIAKMKTIDITNVC